MNIHISIVSPVYNGEQLIDELVNRIVSTLETITKNFEIILVDDCGPDNSWQKIEENCKKDSRVKGVKLSRNFGQHPAIIAGLSKSSGEWVVVMDCDLQDQPKEIIKLYKKAQEGFDVVMARRVNRQDNFLKKTTSKMFSKVFNYLSDVKMNHEVANFGIYNKKVITQILLVGDYIKSFPLFVYFVGFKKTEIEIEHAKRESGKSNYTFFKLLDLAFNGIIAYSNKPLKLFVKLGIIISTSSLFVALYYLIQYIEGKVKTPGYTSLIVSLFFLSGMIISAIGVIGVYLGKVFEQTKNRQPYIIDKIIN